MPHAHFIYLVQCGHETPKRQDLHPSRDALRPSANTAGAGRAAHCRKRRGFKTRAGAGRPQAGFRVKRRRPNFKNPFAAQEIRALWLMHAPKGVPRRVGAWPHQYGCGRMIVRRAQIRTDCSAPAPVAFPGRVAPPFRVKAAG